MLSTAMLFDHLGSHANDARFTQAASTLQHAVDVLLSSPLTRTRDLGGTLGTQAFADAVVERIAR